MGALTVRVSITGLRGPRDQLPATTFCGQRQRTVTLRPLQQFGVTSGKKTAARIPATMTMLSTVQARLIIQSIPPLKTFRCCALSHTMVHVETMILVLLSGKLGTVQAQTITKGLTK
jgi:hypothetical protein